MKLGDLKRELNKMQGIDDWEIHVLIEELPEKLKTTECTKLGVCINDHVIVMGYGKYPHCEGEE